MGSAELSGSIDGIAFDDVKTVFYGNAHIVLFDRDIDCLDVAFIDDNYVDGEDPTEGDQDFIAMQFIFEAGEPLIGTFSVSPDAPVKGLALINTPNQNDGAFTFLRSRGGFMTVTDVSNDTVTGSFESQFSQDTLSGDFEAEYCRNLR